jgi:hypothetical protein
MNKIEAKYFQSKYCKIPHLTIFVDGEPLDIILDKLVLEYDFIGLLPTLLKN